ncbi:MAG: serine hydroxymethyltransferase [Gemmatimonadaceae bacterium]
MITNTAHGEDQSLLVTFAGNAMRSLCREDPALAALLEQEYWRQQTTLALVASCSPTHPSVLAGEGTFASNVTAEGYPGARFHAGCAFVDRFEQLAIDRAKLLFRAEYANVQPHSASTANQIVMGCLLRPGDTLLGLSLDSGGHLSHGSRANISGQFFNGVAYGLDASGRIDYDAVESLAREHRPKLIVCGTTAYPRLIDWARFRAIADAVDAYLLADISHIAGLVATGEHPSPIDWAHVTTTCTHKQLYGPRGGLILMGRDRLCPGPNGNGNLEELMQKGVFPFMQGAPIVNMIVAKARALAHAGTPAFAQLARRIVVLAQALAEALSARGVRIVSGGTDNHIVLADVLGTFGVTGIVAQRALEECGVIVNKNRITGDTKPVTVGSGIRIGTNSLAARLFTTDEMPGCADLIVRILSSVEAQGDRAYVLDAVARMGFVAEVSALCARFPLPGYGPDLRAMGNGVPAAGGHPGELKLEALTV